MTTIYTVYLDYLFTSNTTDNVVFTNITHS